MNLLLLRRSSAQVKAIAIWLTVALIVACDSQSTNSANLERVASSASACSDLITPIDSGYGAKGGHAIETERFQSPNWRFKQVRVFLPDNVSTPVPVIFFSHAYGGTHPLFYRDFIEHIVSRGYAVVYSPYRTLGVDHDTRYDMLWSGFTGAVERYPQILDTNRVGFVGHSYGGGATFAMAYRGLVERGWGSQGSFMFVMAPWYAKEISDEQLLQFPNNTKLVVQVYEDDTITDHRIAIELFNKISVSEKEYIMLRSDSYQNCSLLANHQVPQTKGRRNMEIGINALDYYGVYRTWDALADYTFAGNSRGRSIALGGGNTEQTFMGTWPNGEEVKRAVVSSDPQPVREPSFYKYQNNNMN